LFLARSSVTLAPNSLYNNFYYSYPVNKTGYGRFMVSFKSAYYMAYYVVFCCTDAKIVIMFE